MECRFSAALNAYRSAEYAKARLKFQPLVEQRHAVIAKMLPDEAFDIKMLFHSNIKLPWSSIKSLYRIGKCQYLPQTGFNVLIRTESDKERQDCCGVLQDCCQKGGCYIIFSN